MEDIFTTYPILKLIFGVLACLAGVLICKGHKFYKYDTSDMLFATKLSVFLGGMLFIFIGLCAFASYFFGIF